MIIRSIIFYFYDCKDKAIEIAKLLKGYVDVENGEKDNEHIFIEQFSNIIFVDNANNDKIDKAIKKYELNDKDKHLYIVGNNVINNAVSFDFDLKSNEIANVINGNN